MNSKVEGDTGIQDKAQQSSCGNDASRDQRLLQLAWLPVLYTIIICGTLWWTSTITQVTVYDKYLVRFDGVRLGVSNIGKAVAFYDEVLNFLRPSKPKLSTASDGAPEVNEVSAEFFLPDKRRLYLEQSEQTPGARTPEIILRVRNGFEPLHREILVRVKRFSSDTSPIASVSPVQKQPWGEEFVVTDPDGNIIVFRKAKSRHLARLS